MLEGVARTHQPLPRPEGRRRGAVSSGAFIAAQVVSWPPASQTVWFSWTVEWGVVTQRLQLPGGRVQAVLTTVMIADGDGAACLA